LVGFALAYAGGEGDPGTCCVMEEE